MTALAKLRLASQKRAAYNETVEAIRNMPQDVALDLDIFREDAEKIAYKAVYGG